MCRLQTVRLLQPNTSIGHIYGRWFVAVIHGPTIGVHVHGLYLWFWDQLLVYMTCICDSGTNHWCTWPVFVILGPTIGVHDLYLWFGDQPMVYMTCICNSGTNHWCTWPVFVILGSTIGLYDLYLWFCDQPLVYVTYIWDSGTNHWCTWPIFGILGPTIGVHDLYLWFWNQPLVYMTCICDSGTLWYQTLRHSLGVKCSRTLVLLTLKYISKYHLLHNIHTAIIPEHYRKNTQDSHHLNVAIQKPLYMYMYYFTRIVNINGHVKLVFCLCATMSEIHKVQCSTKDILFNTELSLSLYFKLYSTIYFFR